MRSSRTAKSLFVLAASLFVGTVSAQTTIRVTGWYDGRGVENGFPDDGVPHGLYGLVGAGPLYPLWIPPFGTNYLTHLVRDPTQIDACGLTNIGTFPSCIVPLNADLYTFLGNMHECCQVQVSDGPVQDPIAAVVRYGSDGKYDLQQNLIYFPNPGIDPVPTSATVQYLWGMGAVCHCHAGPHAASRCLTATHCTCFSVV